MKKQRVIAVSNQKGGVTKTTTTVNTATELALKGFKTCIIELDWQCNASFYLNVDGGEGLNIRDVFFEGKSIKEAARPTAYENLDIVPASKAFANAETYLQADSENGSIERRLKRAMKDNDYDYVIIDCPPNLSVLITNAFYVATDIIIPCAAEPFSFQGMDGIYTKIHAAKMDYAEDLERVAILLTLTDMREDLTRSAIEDVEKAPFPRFDTMIRKSVKMQKSTSAQIPLVMYDRECHPSVDYRNLVSEIISMAE
jgi:chromosome partitioning protein